MKKSNLEIFFNDQGQLEIQGKVATESPDKSAKILLQEIYQGPFHRTLALPSSADREKLTFSYNTGILEIQVGKLRNGKIQSKWES
ncbi:Hsp20/alpha crystallin family protein [Paenibacillus sp. TRM 82003]|nr:Hsp20/alpha crystallin family protein [Paenibacillus sp. TRM 82003]